LVRKIQYFLLALVAPEFLALYAYMQFENALDLTNEVRPAFGGKDVSTTLEYTSQIFDQIYNCGVSITAQLPLRVFIYVLTYQYLSRIVCEKHEELS
jgi:hypothetical protein